jgi:hypothetical protein
VKGGRKCEGGTKRDGPEAVWGEEPALPGAGPPHLVPTSPLRDACNTPPQVRGGEWLGSTGKPIKKVVAVGIGGSFLGPLFVHTALRWVGWHAPAPAQPSRALPLHPLLPQQRGAGGLAGAEGGGSGCGLC